MKRSKRTRYFRPGALFASLCLICLTALPAFAGHDESGGGWRSTYDSIMLCINFGILVFIIIRLGKNPLRNFFNRQRQSIADRINDLKNTKKTTAAALEESESLVVAGDAHIQTIRKKLAEEGDAIKQKIIDQAKQQSEFMLANARRKMDTHFFEARKAFQAELVDMAMGVAAERLPREVDKNDQEKLVNQFLYDLAATGR